MASNDPTDTGGLFIGRRPGTGPVHFKNAPPETSQGRMRRDALLAHALLALEVVLCLSLFGPQPTVWLWDGSQVEYLTGYATAGILTVVLGCLASLMLTMAVAKQRSNRSSRRALGWRCSRSAFDSSYFAGPGPSLAPS
jgi:hypothetical protein